MFQNGFVLSMKMIGFLKEADVDFKQFKRLMLLESFVINYGCYDVLTEIERLVYEYNKRFNLDETMSDTQKMLVGWWNDGKKRVSLKEHRIGYYLLKKLQTEIEKGLK